MVGSQLLGLSIQVLIDPAIQALRLSIIAKTNKEQPAKPGTNTTGEPEAKGLPPKETEKS